MKRRPQGSADRLGGTMKNFVDGFRDELRSWPSWGRWAAAVGLLLLIVGVAGGGSDSPEDSAKATAKPVAAQAKEPVATTATAPTEDTAPAEPVKTLDDAAAAVDDGDYAGAVVMAAALGKSAQGRIRSKISRHLARGVRLALRAGDRSKARRLLARADRFPSTPNIAAARADYRAAKARAAARAEQRLIAREATRRRAAERRAARRAARDAERRAEEAAAAAPAADPAADYAGMNCTEIGHSFNVTPGSDPDHDADNDGVACESQ